MQYVQLVLSDPVNPHGAQYGVVSARRSRFVDNGRRLDFLLAGLGWCKMPTHIVAPLLADGRLVLLQQRIDQASCRWDRSARGY